ncbi:phage tail tape measure protein [Streptomyces sp. NBC_01216]|uniref:phage tail tape measure protein n=1 Tax=Streptomyces sp. NBC_01216 TaxID=2903778 RepID=UPI002E15474D|nr:phage tail tape measure protein [Streptomyces sp. NBC_01216]
MGTNQRRSLEAARTGSLALVAAFGFAVFTAAKFEKAMSNVAAVTQASAGEMARLRSAALEAGRTTAYSASQAAEAEFELAKAGISVADIAGGALKGSLSLAAAAQIDLSEAAEISATTMTVFGLKGKDVGHVADVLAAAANKSATDVHQLGLSFKMAGLVAAQTGLSLEDTTGTLALFAAQGMKGSDAGTSLKVMLQRLTPNSKEAQATMDQLGLSAYDATGQFVGLHELAGRMKEAFAGLTPEARNSAMGVIFGSDAVRAASILYKYGEEGVRQYTDAVNDQGYAAAVAAVKMDNLIGDLQLLKSALESALIESGSAANAALRDMVQWVTRLVNIYNGLPPGVQRVIGGLTGVVGVVGLVGASMLLLLPRIMLVRREMTALGVTAASTRAALMTLGRLGLVVGSIMAVGWAIDTVADRFRAAPADVTKMTNAVVDFAQKGKVAGELTRNFGQDLDGFGDAVARIAHPGVLDRIEDFFGTFDPGTDVGGPGLDKAVEKVKAVDEALARLVQSGNGELAANSFKKFAAEAERGGTSADKLRTLMPQYTEALVGVDTEAKLAAGSQGDLADAAAVTADEMADQRTMAEKLSDALDSLNGSSISATEGQIAFEASLDDLTKTVKENGRSLDVSKEKGRDVMSAFLDAAKAAQKHAAAVAEQKGSVEAGSKALGEHIAALRKTMKAAGFTDKQIDELIGTYARLPESKATGVDAPGAVEARRQIDHLHKAVAGLQPGKTITIKAPTGEAIRALKAAGYAVKTIPGSKDVRITAPTGSAVANAQALKRELDRLKSKTVTVHTRFISSTGEVRQLGKMGHLAGGGQVRRYAAGGGVRGFPSGGMVQGPGSSTSDSIPAMLSNGEYVIRAAAVRKYGLGLLDGLNAMSAPLSGTRYTRPTPAPAAQTGPTEVRVFVGDREIRDIVRVETRPLIRESEQRQAYRAKAGRR